MSCWTVNRVNVKGEPKRAINLKTYAAAVGAKIYFFGQYYYRGENHTSVGPLDVQVFETDSYKWSVLRNPNVSLIIKDHPFLHINWRTPVVYKNLVYLFADISYDIRNVLLCYDTSSNIWSKPIMTGITPPATGDFSRLFSCVVNDAMYTFGRFHDRDSSVYAQEVYKLDLKSMKWSHITTTGQPPMYRRGHSTTAIKNSIFIYGGHGDEGNCYDDLISLDTQTKTWVTHEVSGYRPTGRYAHSAVCYKGSLLVFGGICSDQQEAVNYFLRYDPDSRCWSQVKTKGNGPCSMSYHSCVLIQDRVFISGGVRCPMPVYRVYQNHLDNIYACDFAPTLKTLSTVAVLEHKLDQKGLPETIRRDIKLTNPEEFQSGNNDE